LKKRNEKLQLNKRLLVSENQGSALIFSSWKLLFSLEKEQIFIKSPCLAL
jgi:hypothetical protein